MSVKFVVAKPSSQTLRGVRELCEAPNSNKKFRSVQFETLRVYVINANFSALNFTSVNVAKLSSQTLRKSSSFRSLRRLRELAKLSTLSTLHGVQFIQDFSMTLVMHQARLILPLHLHSFSGVNRVWPFLENSEFLCCTHFQLRASESSSSFEIRHLNDPNTPSTYVRPSVRQQFWSSEFGFVGIFFSKSSSDRPKVAKRSSQTLRGLSRLCEAKENLAKLSSQML